MSAYKDTDGTWRFRFSFKGKRYSGTTPPGRNLKKIAEALERDLLDKLVARRFIGEMPTVRTFAEKFLEYQEARTKPLTQVQQKATINTHVVPSCGHLSLDDFDLARIDQLVTDWRQGGAVAKTINTRLGTVRRMLSLAVEWEILVSVPKIRMLKVPEETPRWLTDAEMVKLVNAAEPHWRTMIVVALRTGLRIGELRGLQVGDVYFARRVLQVRRTDPGRRTMDATSPKGKRERTVPLTPDAIAALREAIPARAAGSAWVWPALLRRRGETRARCRSEKGAWAAISRAAQKAELLDVGWHTLRHSYASHLVMRGVPLRTIQKWMGHASITETEKYSHLSPDFGHEAAALLDVPLASEKVDASNQSAAKELPAWDAEDSDI